MELLKVFSVRTKIVLSILFLFVGIMVLKTYVLTENGTFEVIAGLVIALGFGYALSFAILKDLAIINSAAQKVIQGDLNIKVELNSNDEFGLLGKVFNKMIGRINSRIKSSDVLIEVLQRTAHETDVEKTLSIILEGAKKITGAQYAALAIFDKNRKVEKFLQIGITGEAIRHIGHYPEGKGLLGHIHETKTVIRLDDMKKHPKSVGFPLGHPPMKSLIAVPILFGTVSLGNLYVSDKNSANKVFDEDDEHAMKTFAQISANVIQEKITGAEIVKSKKYLETEVTKLLQVIDRLAAGDLTITIEEHQVDDEIGKLKGQLLLMINGLSNLISQVKDAVEATASASAQISSSTEQMSAGARDQNIQATEIAGAVEEMTKTILETSKNTSVASDSAKEAGDKAKEGGKVIVQTIDGMNRIADVVVRSAKTVETLGNSSNQIGEIVQVIDDIADQTNLLALNAAIEAARAGEQGRGFAVVADEVRKLAERTTKATKEIAIMIKQIQKDTSDAVESMNQGTNEVENGKILANKAGDSLQEIISATEKVSDIIDQVATAAEEQFRASDEISKNIEAITTITQETSTGTAQIANATGDLSRLTNRLQDLVMNFKVEETSRTGLTVRKDGQLVSKKKYY
ncbi:MAG: methyl-accepting chemotaxis protein [Ignavibacteria bacterium]